MFFNKYKMNQGHFSHHKKLRENIKWTYTSFDNLGFIVHLTLPHFLQSRGITYTYTYIQTCTCMLASCLMFEILNSNLNKYMCVYM